MEEKDLNSFNPDLSKLIDVIINKTALNQAMLESIINLQQITMEHSKIPNVMSIPNIMEVISKRTLEIQAEITSKNF